jgi:hypothetical protein
MTAAPKNLIGVNRALHCTTHSAWRLKTLDETIFEASKPGFVSTAKAERMADDAKCERRCIT